MTIPGFDSNPTYSNTGRVGDTQWTAHTVSEDYNHSVRDNHGGPYGDSHYGEGRFSDNRNPGVSTNQHDYERQQQHPYENYGQQGHTGDSMYDRGSTYQHANPNQGYYPQRSHVEFSDSSAAYRQQTHGDYHPQGHQVSEYDRNYYGRTEERRNH